VHVTWILAMMEVPVTRRIKSRRRPASERRQLRPCSAPEQLTVTLMIPQHVQEKLSYEWIVKTSAKALLLHTLYSRGVCPASAMETLREFQENDGTRRANPVERKFAKFGGSLQRLLEEWVLFCSFVHFERVLITLGPSWSRQREHHILDFSGLSVGKADSERETKTEPGIGQEHALSRRLTRVLLDEISDEDSEDKYRSLAHPSPSGSSYMVHLSVWITHQTADKLFTQCVNDESVACEAQQLLQSLILRPGFTIQQNASKRTQPHVVTARVSSSTDKIDGSDWKEENGVWVSLPTTLNGFRL